jgi:RNA polymerase sigma-70 factor (ECF subfamily)
LAAAAQAMRRILVDHARARQAEKRGDHWVKVSLTGMDAGTDGSELEILALNDALEGLKQQSERVAAVVEMRYFGGLSVEEIAVSLGVSTRTVTGDWKFARAWLKRAMTG